MRRAVITNGDWLVAFLKPDRTFVELRPDPEDIIVFETSQDIENRATEVFEFLEHQQVVREVPPLRIGQLAFLVSGNLIDQMMMGVRVLYQEVEDFFGFSPDIRILPIAFLRTLFGTWVQIESEDGVRLPHKRSELHEHCSEVRQISLELEYSINEALGLGLQPVSLGQHYAEAERSGIGLMLPGFSSRRNSVAGAQEFTVITGSERHYFRTSPGRQDCQYHAASGVGPGIADRFAILQRSTDRRSFFVDGEDQHCAHPNLIEIKAAQLTRENRERCGPRSGQDTEAFCEIYKLDRHLCCRTCAFEEVCTKRSVFVAPCPGLILSGVGGLEAPSDKLWEIGMCRAIRAWAACRRRAEAGCTSPSAQEVALEEVWRTDVSRAG